MTFLCVSGSKLWVGQVPRGKARGCLLEAEGGLQPRLHLLFWLDLGLMVLVGPVNLVHFPHISPPPEPARGSQMPQLHLVPWACSLPALSLGLPCLLMRMDEVLRSWG